MSLLKLYYNVGKIIYDNSEWGNKFIDEIARELKISFPNIKGFSVRNLKSMKKYYLICSQNEKVQTASAQIPWSHNMLILKKIDRKIIIVSKNVDEVLIKKYKSQYSNITFINNNLFHDRFIIVDRIKLYLCGASFKDLGKKRFAINEFLDKNYLINLLDIINV